MNRHTQTTGVRYWAGNDFIELQSETLRILDGFFEQFGALIVCGCEIENGIISEGLAGLWGDDPNGRRVYKVAPVPRYDTGGAFPVYLRLKCTEDLREYGDGNQKPVREIYTAEISQTIPQGTDYLTLNAADTKRFTDVIQDSKHRFLTDEQVGKLAGIAEGANKYTHPAHTSRTNGLYKITVNTLGHVTAATTATKSDIGLGNVDNTKDADKTVKHALTANTATNANHATTAESATNAQNAMNATNAQTASTATKAQTVTTITKEQVNGAIGYTPANPADVVPRTGAINYSGFLRNPNTYGKAVTGVYLGGAEYYGLTSINSSQALLSKVNGSTAEPMTTANTFQLNLDGRLIMRNGAISNNGLRSIFATWCAGRFFGIVGDTSEQATYGCVNSYGEKATTPTAFVHNFSGYIHADRIVSRATNISSNKVLMCTDGGTMPVITEQNGVLELFTDKVPYVFSDGTMEIGNKIDLHNTLNTQSYAIQINGVTAGQLRLLFHGLNNQLAFSNNYINCQNTSGTIQTLYLQNSKFNFDANGNFRASGTITQNSPSDKRLKKQIKTLSGGLNTVLKLRPVTFKWNAQAKKLDDYKDTELNNFGFIAQEIEETAPEIIRPIYENYKAIDIQQLIAVLTAAIQEQNEIINNLSRRVERLEKGHI